MKTKHFFGVTLVMAIILVLTFPAMAETINSNDGSGASCECIVVVPEGTGDWDHGSCDQYDPWQYWPQGGGNWTCDNAQAGSEYCAAPHYCGGGEPTSLPDNCWFDRYYDVRTYDSSHPGADKIDAAGGWTTGLACLEGTNGITKVEIIAQRHKVTFDIEDDSGCYIWGGQLLCDYTIRYGSHWYVGSPVTVNAYIGDDLVGSQELELPKNIARPPFTEIKKMAILKSGEIKMRFTAPYDIRDNQIRVRIFDETNETLVHQIKILPPYQRNGKPDELEILIPGEYTGRFARIEYRVFDDGFMSRAVTAFKLPEIE